MGRTNPFTPRRPTSGDSGTEGQGLGQQALGLAAEPLSWRELLGPPCAILGPGGPSQQVSCLSSRQAELDSGHPLVSLPAALSPNPGRKRMTGLGGWGEKRIFQKYLSRGEGQEVPGACRELLGMFSKFILCRNFG